MLASKGVQPELLSCDSAEHSARPVLSNQMTSLRMEWSPSVPRPWLLSQTTSPSCLPHSYYLLRRGHIPSTSQRPLTPTLYHPRLRVCPWLCMAVPRDPAAPPVDLQQSGLPRRRGQAHGKGPTAVSLFGSPRRARDAQGKRV